MCRILIVEDEKQIARFLELELKYEGYEVDVAYDGKSGLEMIHANHYHLILLDIMLPQLNGMEVCRKVRKFSDVPIIMVTAKDEDEDIVRGLDLGAHDYITKPYSTEVLLARIRRLLKWSDTSDKDQHNTLTVKDLSLNLSTYEVYIKDQKVELTKKEFDLLNYLLVNKSIVLGREQILSEIWGYDYIGDTNVVDVYIRYLRSKIDDVAGEKYIHTVRGVGYVIKE